MDKSNELATNPVSGWNIRGVQPYNALLLQFQYLSSPMQRLEDAHESRHYILTQEQAIELAEAIFGPDLGAIKGKTTKRKAAIVRGSRLT